MRRKLLLAASALALVTLGPSTARAVPAAVPYVGYLADGDGPFDGMVAVSVELFDQAEDGVSLWGPHLFPEVEVEEGLFTVVLGAADSPELDGILLPAGGAWLDFAIDGTALAPRQKLLSVPYALLADHAQSCDEAAALDELAAGDFATALHDHEGLYAAAAALTLAVERLDNAEDRLNALEASLAAQQAQSVGLQETVDGLQVTAAGQEATIAANELALADLEQQLGDGGCPSDMVAVGDFCVDKVEASMWRRLDGEPVECGAVQAAVEQASAAPWNWNDSDFDKWYQGTDGQCKDPGEKPDLCQYKQYGSPPGCVNILDCSDYPEPRNGNWEAPIYSCAIFGVGPARANTWFEAQQACVWSGKRLCYDPEWQAAAAGTPDPHSEDPGDDSEACNIWKNSKPADAEWVEVGQSIKAGSAKECVSSHGAYDMVGNLMEVTADWWGQGPDDADGAQVNVDYNTDGFWNIDDAEYPGSIPPHGTFPAAAHRGGAWSYGSKAGVFAICLTNGPAHWHEALGFRCCRSQ